MNTNDIDKLKKRQQQLEAWKQKKLQREATAQTGDVVDEEEKKKQERQRRIEEWKKKRLEKTSEIPANIPVATSKEPLLKLKKVSKPKVTVIKRSILDDGGEDEDELRPKKFKKPSLDAKHEPEVNDTEEMDLDQLLSSLEDGNKMANEVQYKEDDEESEAEEETTDDILTSRLKKLQEREKSLKEVNHSAIEYQPFRKCFYKPSKELESMTDEQINQIRSELSGITVNGVDCPVPITKWTQLGLPSSMIELFKLLNYEKPSAIQSQSLPAIMSGRDVLGVAKTGSGKTLSFVLPMIRHVQDQEQIKKGIDGPIALILTPTRELALQINKEIMNFGKAVTSCCCYGGSNIENQINELRKGVQVIVGTPGRVIDLLTVNSGRVTNLSRVTYLVLDEADRMYDMGFEPQVNKILSQIRPDRQTVLFSATFPRKLEKLAKNGLKNPIEIVVGGINTVASEIDQQVELFDAKDVEPNEVDRQKFLKLIEIIDQFMNLNKASKLLIFVEKQDLADQLMVQLISSDYNCLSIHGGKDQIDRKFAIKEFSSATSDLNILIATSIAARGLDVKGLDLVVNYDAPSHLEDYIHRVGRTGRAGLKGKAITFVTNMQERSIADIVKVLNPPIDSRLIEISDEFTKKVKNGNVKYNLGFGGKGLEKLQQQRDTVKDMERQRYEEKPAAENSNPAPKTDDFELPDFDIVEGIPPDSSGPDRSRFHSRITINNLPQKVRWFVSNRESISKIIESTSCSITHKGQYYAPGSKPKKDQPAKLYLLVEALNKSDVERANQLIKQQMIEGLQLESQSSSKYTV